MGASTLERHRSKHARSCKQLASIGYPGTLSHKAKKEEVALKQGAKVALKKGALVPSVQKKQKSMGAHAAGAGGKLQEERQPNKEEVALKKGALMPEIFGHDEMSIPKKNVWVPMLLVQAAN